MGLKHVLPLRVWVELGVMVMKGYFTLFRSLELELHQFTNDTLLFGGSYVFVVDTVRVSYSPVDREGI